MLAMLAMQHIRIHYISGRNIIISKVSTAGPHRFG